MVGPLLIKLIVRNGKKKVKRNFKFWDLWDILKKKKKELSFISEQESKHNIPLLYIDFVHFIFFLVICTLFGTK